MPVDYSGHYQLMRMLALDPNILPSSVLYPFRDDLFYAAMMDRLAAPLEGGVESPFSSRNPLSGHGQLVSIETYMFSVLAHEFNLIPDYVWLNHFRMLGVELAGAERPVINLVFARSQDAIASDIPARIPLGTRVVSTVDADLVATTLFEIEIAGDAETGAVPARLNYSGKISAETRIGEFSVLPEVLAFVDYAYNDGTVIFAGRDAETLPQAMLRARQEFQMGQRCVTARDFYRLALSLGAQKVNVLPGVKKGAIGRFGNLVTVVVYPGSLARLIESAMQEMVPLPIEVEAVAAEIIPVAGKVSVRIVPNLSNLEAFNIAAQAISSNVNPPYGVWGDTNFPATLATALENQPKSIYAVPQMELFHSRSGKPLNELDIRGWDLFEVQQGIEFSWLR